MTSFKKIIFMKVKTPMLTLTSTNILLILYVPNYSILWIKYQIIACYEKNTSILPIMEILPKNCRLWKYYQNIAAYGYTFVLPKYCRHYQNIAWYKITLYFQNFADDGKTKFPLSITKLSSIINVSYINIFKMLPILEKLTKICLL